MIELKKISKKFGRLQVLNDLTVNFTSGKATAVIGHNGSGKTTMIKCILGMVQPDKGAVIFDGSAVNGQWEYRSRLGYMPQIGRYPDNMSIGQIIRMVKDIRSSWNQPLDEELLHAFELEKMHNKKMGVLSGGTRQKVSAALAFLFTPDVLILDEPTAGLDPVASEILKEKIHKERNNGKLIIITSHIMSEIEELADELVFIYDGQVAFERSIAELKKESGNERIGKVLKDLIQKTGGVV